MLKSFILVCVLCSMFVVTTHAQISAPDRYVPQMFDVLHYDAVIKLANPAQREIEADVTMHVRWTASANNPSFPFHLRGLQIDSVHVNAVQSPFVTIGEATLDTMHHRVAMSHAVTEGTIDTVRVFYHGTMTNEGGSMAWGGVHYADSVLYCLGVGFSAPHVSTTQHWLACYDHPSDKATFRGRFIVPEGNWTVASVGQRIATRPPWPSGFQIFDWYEGHPTATYLLTFAVAPYVTMEVADSVPHVFYTLRRDSSGSSRAYRNVPRMTRALTERYGRFPFDKVGYCNTQLGAMEHQTMISMPVSIAQRGDTTNVTAAHELAHQWFGDCVSPLDFRYAWLTESFATFTESVWLEELSGWNTYLLSVQTKARAYVTRIARDEGVFALEDFPRTPPSSNYPQTIYQKGAVVVAMARAIAGDSAFFAALQQYIQQNEYGTATTAHMREALRPALREKTDAFFREWVTGRGWAKLSVNTNKTTKTVTIRQVQQQTNAGWPLFTTLPLNVVVQYGTGSSATISDVILYPDERGVITIQCDSLISVNAGTQSRVLAEVVETTVSVINGGPSSDTHQWSLSPNPTADHVRVSRTHSTGDATILIVDAQGKLLPLYTMRDGDATLTLQTNGLPAGSYTVLIQAADTRVAMPLVITRGE